MTTYLELSALTCGAVVLTPLLGAKGVRWSAAVVVAVVAARLIG